MDKGTEMTHCECNTHTLSCTMQTSQEGIGTSGTWDLRTHSAASVAQNMDVGEQNRVGSFHIFASGCQVLEAISMNDVFLPRFWAPNWKSLLLASLSTKGLENRLRAVSILVKKDMEGYKVEWRGDMTHSEPARHKHSGPGAEQSGCWINTEHDLGKIPDVALQFPSTGRSLACGVNELPKGMD